MAMRLCPVRLMLLLGTALLSGCRPQPAGPKPVGYFGPTEPLGRLVGEVNQNNSRLKTLWAKGDFEATIVDRGRSSFVNGEVLLLHRKPGDLRLVGRKDVAGSIFEVGANAEQFWLLARADVDTLWWGEWATLGERRPKDIPIRPDLMLEVLGVSELETDLLKPPVPVMRFNNDADAYMVVWNRQTADRWVALKEVWYDRATRLPKLVLLFDEGGRIVVRAYVSDHKPVQGEDDWASGALVATRYQLLFPESGTQMRITLQRLQDRSGAAPGDGSFRFPGSNAGVSRIVRVDQSDEGSP